MLVSFKFKFQGEGTTTDQQGKSLTVTAHNLDTPFRDMYRQVLTPPPSLGVSGIVPLDELQAVANGRKVMKLAFPNGTEHLAGYIKGERWKVRDVTALVKWQQPDPIAVVVSLQDKDDNVVDYSSLLANADNL